MVKDNLILGLSVVALFGYVAVIVFGWVSEARRYIRQTRGDYNFYYIEPAAGIELINVK